MKSIHLAVLFCLLVAPPAFAKGVKDGSAHKTQKKYDATFVHSAVQGGMTEVKLGDLAQQKAADSRVKDLAKMISDDHSKANDELKQLASNKGIKVPDQMTNEENSTYAKLEKDSGPAFDKLFVNTMIKEHKKTIELFEKESSKGTDPDLKKFASDTLPTLQKHLSTAEDLKK